MFRPGLHLVIGNRAYSSWSMRGWLACRLSGLPFEVTVAPLYDADWESRRTEADLAPSGGRVPILWDGGVGVWDSSAILDHLAEKVGSGRYWPADPAARALARSMAAEMHAGFAALRREHPMNTRRRFPARPVSAEVAADLARVAELWARARGFAGDGGRYLFGAFGAADVVYAPVASRVLTYDLPLPPPARAYAEAVLDHAYAREWLADAEREEWVLDRYENRPAE